MADADQSILLLCYNKGCGKQYAELDNHEAACTFHPGAPFFHDAYKGWSCCKKKCTDFTEFLNTKGCTNSFHSNVKPPEPEKLKANNVDKDEVVEYRAPVPLKREVVQRPSDDTPVVRLAVTISQSLKQLLVKQKEEKSQPQNVDNSGISSITIGTSCKNSGCKQAYEGEQSDLGTCTYHNGVPIFHEGLKFWSCCQRKTTEFDIFLDQEGCQIGSHIWIKPSGGEGEAKRSACRYDWHQTGSLVVISVYAKGADPERSYVEASPVKLHTLIRFGDNLFEEDILLCGIIDVANSSVNMAATKVEIKLRKAEFFSWSKLAIPRQLPIEENEKESADISVTGIKIE